MNIQVLKRYSHQGLCRAIDIFNYPQEFPRQTRLLGFRFLLQYNHMDRRLAPNLEKIVKQMKEMVDEYYKIQTQEAYSTLMELVDMLLDYSQQDGEKLLAYLREQRVTANNSGVGGHDNGPECTVYGDSQSVHNKTLSESTRNAAKYLCDNYPLGLDGKKKIEHYERVRMNLIQKFGDNFEPIIDRIYIDNAHFNIGYTVDEVLMSLLKWTEKEQEINKQFSAKDFLNRMREEFIEMENYCSSGILARLINTLQGFTDDESLHIKISDKEQIKGVVYAYLNKEIQASKNEIIMEEMMTNGENFTNFVLEKIEIKKAYWFNEYGEEDVQKYLPAILNQYTNSQNYS